MSPYSVTTHHSRTYGRTIVRDVPLALVPQESHGGYEWPLEQPTTRGDKEMDQDEIKKIADFIVSLFVTEETEYISPDEYKEIPAIQYLHCGCCSTTVLMDDCAMTREEMISILTEVRSLVNKEIGALRKAKVSTRTLNNR